MSSPRKRSRSPKSPRHSQLDECNVFVKYLPADLTEEQFFDLFKEFGPIVSSKIMIDQNSGKSLGFGFVRFGNSESSKLAISEMNGNQIQNKRLLCKLANQSQNSDNTNYLLKNQIPSNNLYIKPLLPDTTEDDLRELFEPFGKINTCKVMIDHRTKKSKQIGFVKFETKEEARRALENMNNYKLEENAIPLVVKYEDSQEQKFARKSFKQQMPKYDNRSMPTNGLHPVFMYYPSSPPPMVLMGNGGFSYPPYPGMDFPIPYSPPSYSMAHTINPDSFGGSPIYPYSWNPDFQLSPYGPGTPNPNYYAFEESDELSNDENNINIKSSEEIETLLLDESGYSTNDKSHGQEREDIRNDFEDTKLKTRPIAIKQRTKN
jgi:RNA recognition motif-containing protein